MTGREETLLLSKRIKELEEAYRWKAENIVRFLEKLRMTPKQKVDFVANELACAHEFGHFHEELKKRGVKS